jgi:predicted HicB family RNase H-like nuclease
MGGSERKTGSTDFSPEGGASGGDFGPVKCESNPSGATFGSPGGESSQAESKSNRSVPDFGLKASKRGGGGKLSRTETVTVRLDPKLRYLADLAARKQRRTLSSFIEWAIEENLKNIHLDDAGDVSNSIASQATELWDVDAPDRFAKLAVHCPELLTHDEQVLWKLIRENGSLWKGHYDRQTRQWTWRVSLDTLIFENLRKSWEAFCSVAYENGSEEKLPTWEKEVFF